MVSQKDRLSREFLYEHILYPNIRAFVVSYELLYFNMLFSLIVVVHVKFVIGLVYTKIRIRG